MTRKLEVTPKEASELLAEGYTVKCYLVLGPPQECKERPEKVFVPPEALVARSVEGRDPSKGKIAKVWATASKALWAKDVTKIYTRAEVDTALKAAGDTDTGTFSYLRRCGAIRLVKEK
jgi:hypothetical protein